MWTFEILKKTKTDENTIELVVKFDNGTNNFQRTFYATKGIATRSWLEGVIKQEVAEFEKRNAFNLDIKVGVFTPATPPTPTQEQIDKDDFTQSVAKLARMKKLVDLGVIQDSALTTLRQHVTTLYREDWVDGISLL